MFRKLIVLFVFFITAGLNAQNFNLNSGWNLAGSIENNITTNQFYNDNVSTIWKWSGSSWKVWSPDNSTMSLVASYGLTSFNSFYSGEGFWINTKNNISLNALAMCPTRFLPVATVASDYKSGGYAIYDYINKQTFSNLNSYSLGGDIRTYFHNGYIFVVDAPNSGDISSWYVYKIDNNETTLNQTDATSPIANYNINRQNPHSIAFANDKKAYLTTYYDNSILIFNPLTGNESGSIDLTPYLYTSDNGTKNKYIGAEHTVIYKNKLFVTLDRARTYYGDVKPDKSMILQINIDTDTVEKTLKVEYSPRAPQIYGNYLYFVSMGDYSSPIGEIYRVNLSTFEIDNNFKISSPVKSDNSTDYIKNFVITPDGVLYFVANSGWGKPYNVYRILNVNLYNDSLKTGLETTPVYSSDGYVSDMDYFCGSVVVTDRGTNPGLVFIRDNGETDKISDSDLGYPPYKIGTDANY